MEAPDGSQNVKLSVLFVFMFMGKEVLYVRDPRKKS